MHAMGIIHRDLKLHNILVLDNRSLDVVVADFGSACYIKDQAIYGKSGTPGYIPPEYFDDLLYTEKSDIFSLGCLFYKLINGTSLF